MVYDEDWRERELKSGKVKVCIWVYKEERQELIDHGTRLRKRGERRKAKEEENK